MGCPRSAWPLLEPRGFATSNPEVQRRTRRKIQGRDIKVDEHEKIVDWFVHWCCFNRPAPLMYIKWRLDFSCKMEDWIHVQNLIWVQFGWFSSNFPKLFGLKLFCTLRALFEAVNDLRLKSQKNQSCSSRKNEELLCWSLLSPCSSWPLNRGRKKRINSDVFVCAPTWLAPYLSGLYGSAPHLR
jgi:hypothetical protein